MEEVFAQVPWDALAQNVKNCGTHTNWKAWNLRLKKEWFTATSLKRINFTYDDDNEHVGAEVADFIKFTLLHQVNDSSYEQGHWELTDDTDYEEETAE